METLEKKIAAEESRRNVLRKESEKSKAKIIRLVDIQEMVFREYSVVEAQELKAVQLRHLELLMNRQSKSAETDVEASDFRQQYESSVHKLSSDIEEIRDFFHGLGKYEKKDEQIRALEASIKEGKKKISQESALLKGKIGLLNEQKENGLLTKNVFSKRIDKLTHELSLLKKPFLAADEAQFQKVGMSKDKINAYLDKLVEHINNQNDYVVDESDEDIDDVKDEPQESPVEEEEEIVESDIELEGDLVEPDNDPYQKMGDPSVEVSEENHDASQEFKGQAMEAISDGKLEEAIEHLTHAILLNPTSAIMCATRATVYIKMKKPNAAIRDATAALEINPDSAKGYKSRGIARAMLGQWEEAAKDLHVASKLDYDEEIVAALKKVETNAHKIEEHRRKYDRLRKEREDRKSERDRQRHRAEAQAAYEKAKKQEQSSSSRAGSIPGGFPGGMPGGFPGMGRGMPSDFPTGMGGGMPAGMGGGMPAGMGGGMPRGMDYSKILNDPELMAAFQDPEGMAALQDVMKNPANLAKHQGNPKVAPIIAKMMSKFAGPQ